jgi:hypothetical protein
VAIRGARNSAESAVRLLLARVDDAGAVAAACRNSGDDRSAHEEREPGDDERPRTVKHDASHF